MSKKKSKELNKEEVSKFRPNDPTDDLAQIMGFGLQSAYDLGLKEGAYPVSRTNPEVKAGNVDALPEVK